MRTKGPASPSSERHRRLAPALLYCGLLVIWLAMIAIASTGIASRANTELWIWQVLRLFSPDAAPPSPAGDPSALSEGIRKLAHVIEYTILGLLAAYALKSVFPNYVGDGGSRRVLRKAAMVVVPFGALVAAIDELHQSFLPSRTGLSSDTVIDVAAVALGVLVVWLIARRRGA